MKKQPRWKRIVQSTAAVVTTVVTTAAIALIVTTSTQAADKYVEQTGGASCSSGSGSPMSVANYNAGSCTVADGDTVHFSGTITSVLTLQDSGSMGSRVTYDFTGATVNESTTLCAGSPFFACRINVNGLSHINIYGGTFASGTDDSMLYAGTSSPVSDLTVSGWTFTGPTGGTSRFVFFEAGVSDLLVENNTMDNGTNMVDFYRASNDVTIQNNYFRSSNTTSAQVDIVRLTDCRVCTVQGNALIMRAPGGACCHNDNIQIFQCDCPGSQSPDNLVIRYNWIESAVTGGDGSAQWIVAEDGTANAVFMKIYANVFIGDNSGISSGINGAFQAGANERIYIYNNTLLRLNSPLIGIRMDDSNVDLYMRNNVIYASSPGTEATIYWGASMPEEAEDWNYNFTYNQIFVPSELTGANGSTSIDPEFENIGSQQFWFASTSDLIGTGDNSIGSEYNQCITQGATWPGPALETRTGNWGIGAYCEGAGGSPPSTAARTGLARRRVR